MKQLCIIIALLFYIGIIVVTGQNVITPGTDKTAYIDSYNISVLKVFDNNCECIKYDCGCCQFMEWDAVSLNGTLCANVSYLEYDYGISITMTFNNFAIINETVSAKNPPPICIGEDIVESIQIEVCLHIFDIDIGPNGKFHACFEILGKIMRLEVGVIRLGCVDTKVYNKIGYVENNVISRFSRLFHKRRITNSTLPNIVIV